MRNRGFVSTKEASQLAKVTIDTVLTWGEKGYVHRVRIGHEYYFHLESLKAHIEKRGDPPDPSKTMPIGKAAILAGVSTDTVLSWIKKGKISGRKYAGIHYVDTTSFKEHLGPVACKLLGIE